ncbi:sensor histidine kinase [Haloferula sp.]|uniref:sensor histidine kinase n=1 Tax=Haloferula sp. TaxID=2497595 RepID=UPI003C7590E6
MNWVILVWGMVAAACLTLGLVHLLAWSQNRRAKASLAFSIAATSVAACAACELGMMLSTNPEQINAFLGYGGLTILGLNVGLVAYVCLEFGTGNCWLAGASIALRLLSAIVSLSISGNDIYREVTAVGSLDLLGTQVSVITEAISSPWVHLNNLSSLLWIVFMVDASLRLWRRGGRENRRRAGVVGGSIVLFLLLAGGMSALQEYHIIRIPYFISLSFLPIIVVIAFELGRSLIQVAGLADELRQSEAALSLAADSAGAGLWALDSDGKCLWLTERARQLHGFSANEVPDLDRIRETWHPDDRERVEKALTESLSTGTKFQAEYRVSDGNDATRWLSSRGRPYTGEDGEPDRLMGASIDISAQRQAAEELLRHDRELAHMSRVSLVGELSGALVHDLGQPLGAVLANAETARLLLDVDVPNRDELRAILTDIQDDSVRGGQIIHGMRTFLKQQEIDFQPLDMERLFAEVEKLANPDATQRRTTLTFHTAAGLPQVHGHRVQMQQVILNLILNGLQAMEDCPPDERTLHVAASIEDDGQLHVAVKDCGPGLPADKLDQVFTPFLTTKATGLGMGLSICRRIIQSHGGRIWIENNAGAGATAHIILPIPEGK